MKKINNKVWKSGLALILIFAMITQLIFVGAKTDSDSFGVGNKIVNTTSDLNTDIPKTTTADGVAGFGEIGADGRVWVDKSVTDKDDGTFNVKLSALTQEFTSTKTGLTASSPAADVVFILDGSASMETKDVVKDDGSKAVRLEAMIDATNEAISIIMKANLNNRIAVYWYNGGTATGDNSMMVEEFLPLDSYTIDPGENKYLLGGNEYIGVTYMPRFLFCNETLRNKAGNLVAPRDSTDVLKSKHVMTEGGTSTQRGVAYGLNEIIKDIEKSQDTVERKPYAFLLSDGGATFGTEEWWNDSSFNNTKADIGCGNENDGLPTTQLDQVTAAFILSTAQMKDKLTNAYNKYNVKNGYSTSKTKFFTVGLGSDINGPYTTNIQDDNHLKYAWIGLQPSVLTNIDGLGTPQKKAISDVNNQIDSYVKKAVDESGNSDLANYKDSAYYNYSDFYSYANNYADLEDAFKELADDVETATKVIQPPVETDSNKYNSSIYFHDNIGTGMLLNSDLILSVDGGKTTVKGKLSHDASGDIYKFDGFKGQAIVIKNSDGTIKSIDWYVSADDLKECTYTIQNGGGYNTKEPLALSYDLKLDESVEASSALTYYTNIFTGTTSDKEAGTYTTFKPTKDNPYYYYTNNKTGKVDKLINVGFDTTDTDITHYVKGEEILSADSLEDLKDIYVTLDMVNASGGALTSVQVGIVISELPIDKLPADTTGLSAALLKSIKNCKQNASVDTDDGSSYYAFLIGVQKEHNHIVDKDSHANKTDTTTYLSKESFANGQIKMLLGNNGRVDITHDITKATKNVKVVPGDTITYEIVVSNYTNNDSSGLTISDDVPSELVNVENATATSVVATYNLTGNTVTWDGLKVPKNSSVTLSVTAKVPTNPTVTKYENKAKIVNVEGNLVNNPATSNKVESTVNAGIKINVNKDNMAWNDHNKTFQVKGIDGKTYILSDHMPDGKYTIMDGTTDTNKEIEIKDRSGTATLDYYTLTLNAGAGITKVEEKTASGTAGTNANEYIFLKGQIAEINATIDSGYEFVDWTNGGTATSVPTDASKANTTIIVNDTVGLIANAKKIESKITLDVHLNDGDYSGFDKTKVMFVNDDDNSIITDFTKVPNGNYTILVDGVKTNVKFKADGTDQSVIVDYYTLTVDHDAGVDKTTGTGNYLKGSTVSIGATMKPDFTFEKWDGTVKDGSDVNTNTVVVVGQMIVTAKTTANPVINTGIQVDIELNLDDAEWKGHGKDIAIKDASGNKIDPDDVPVGIYTIYDGNTSTGKTFTVTQDDVDNQKNKNLTLDYYSMILHKDTGIDTVKEKNGKYVFLKGTTGHIDATLENNYEFTNWTNSSGNVVYEKADNSIVMNGKVELTAHAKEIYEVNIDVRLDGSHYAGYGKTITLKDDQGNVVTDLTKVPNENYTVLVDGDETYLKVKVSGSNQNTQLEYFTVTVNKGTGILDVSGGGIYLKEETATINTTIEAGYDFKDWTGSQTITSQQKEVVVDQSLNYTANAEKSIKDHKVVVDVKKDGSIWDNHDKTVTLKDSSGNIVTSLNKVNDGTYTVYVDGVSTGKKVIVNGNDSHLILDYYSLILEKGIGIQEAIGAGVYLDGTNVSIDAKSMNGYHFSSWTGTFDYLDALQTIYMNQKIVLTAKAINTSGNGDSPKTSDETLVMLYSGLFVISGLFGTCLYIRKRLKNK